MQKHVNLVDLVKSFPTIAIPMNIYLQNLASMQKRTSPLKIAHLAEKSENGSMTTKAITELRNERTDYCTAGCNVASRCFPSLHLSSHLWMFSRCCQCYKLNYVLLQTKTGCQTISQNYNLGQFGEN